MSAHTDTQGRTRPLQGTFTLPDNDPEHVFETSAELRTTRPAAYTEDLGGYWALTRFEDVRAAAADSETYISSVKAVVPSDPRGIRRPPLNFDAPRHTPFRRALNRTLAPGRVAALSGRISARAETLFEEFIGGEEDDIARTFGTLLPAYAEAIWLNLDSERVAWLAQTATAWVDAWRRQDAGQVTRHSEAMYEVARWLVADRRLNPRDPREDPASSLLSERVDGVALDEEHIVGALRQSLVVGMVAPPLLIGGIARHLALDHELHRRLRSGAVPRKSAWEELLRMYTPYRGLARTVSRPTELEFPRKPGRPALSIEGSLAGWAGRPSWRGNSCYQVNRLHSSTPLRIGTRTNFRSQTGLMRRALTSTATLVSVVDVTNAWDSTWHEELLERR